MIEKILELVNTDANLVRRGRFLSTTFLIEIGDKGYLVKIIEGRIVSVTPGPFVTPTIGRWRRRLFGLWSVPGAVDVIPSECSQPSRYARASSRIRAYT